MTIHVRACYCRYASDTRLIELFIHQKGKKAEYPLDYRGVYVLEQDIGTSMASASGSSDSSSDDFVLRIDSDLGSGSGGNRSAARKGSSLKLELSAMQLQILYPPASKLDGSNKLFCSLFMNKFEAG